MILGTVENRSPQPKSRKNADLRPDVFLMQSRIPLLRINQL